MTTCAPGVDAARIIKDVDYDDLLPIAAVPVPVLYSDAQAAMACGAWLEAGELLDEVVRLEPGFEHARELRAQARRACARATRRKPIVDPWPVLISAAALVLVPVATGLATAVNAPAAIPAPPTVMPALPTAMPAPPTAMLALLTAMPALPTLVPPPPVVAPAPPTPVPAAATAVPVAIRPATPTVLRLVSPTPMLEPTLAEPEVAPAPAPPVLAPQLDQPPALAPEATPEEVVIRQPPVKQDVTR